MAVRCWCSFATLLSPSTPFAACSAAAFALFITFPHHSFPLPSCRRGQVLLGTVNEDALVPFVSQQLQNLDLAMAIAKRGNLPGAEGLVVQQFQRLYAGGQYKEAAELAADSPQGALRTKETIESFKRVPAQPGQTSPLLVYFGTILTKSRLNPLESVELGSLVMSQNKKQLLDNWWKVRGSWGGGLMGGGVKLRMGSGCTAAGGGEWWLSAGHSARYKSCTGCLHMLTCC